MQALAADTGLKVNALTLSDHFKNAQYKLELQK